MKTNLQATPLAPVTGSTKLHPRTALLAAVALSAGLSACAIEAPSSDRVSAQGIGVEDCSHDVCEVGPPLDATCDPCTELVCSGDTFCCEVEWDEVCVQQAELVCGLDCSGDTCEHDMCEVGGPLDPACDECVATVCSEDSFCCETAWDSSCIDAVFDLCGLDCGDAFCGDGTCDSAIGEDCGTCPEDCGPCDECEHDVCETGGPLDPSCSDCAEAVCDVDPFCCDVSWDSICVGLAENICGVDCGLGPECGNGTCETGESCLSCAADCGECPECPHSPCEQGSALPLGCDSCTPSVCKLDSFCCQFGWDSICVGLAEQHCGTLCDAAL